MVSGSINGFSINDKLMHEINRTCCERWLDMLNFLSLPATVGLLLQTVSLLQSFVTSYLHYSSLFY